MIHGCLEKGPTPVYLLQYTPEYLLQYSCLEHSMDWWATVNGVSKSQTQLSNFHFQGEVALVAVVVQPLSCVRLFVTPRMAACQSSLSFIISQSLLKLMSVESVMPSNHLILCCFLLLLPSTFPSIRVFANELVLPIR